MSELIDNLISEWQVQRADLDPSAMGVVGRVLILASRLEQQACLALKPFELQYTEFDVLATLRRKGKPFQLNPKQLMGAVLLTSGAMTACLDRLEKRELINRIADPNDRRGRLIVLTAMGKKLVDKAVEKRFEQASLALKKITTKERKQLEELLAKMLA